MRRWNASRSLPIALSLAGCAGDPDPGQAEATTETGSTAGEDGCWTDPPGEPDPDASVMKTWGAACAVDADCEALLGSGAICMLDAILYELPGGYCSKPCTLPDPQTTVVPDAPECDPAGGVDCVGSAGFFERCVVECTEHSQCARDGYQCRLMPLIGKEGDPTICMMDDCCEGDCADG